MALEHLKELTCELGKALALGGAHVDNAWHAPHGVRYGNPVNLCCDIWQDTITKEVNISAWRGKNHTGGGSITGTLVMVFQWRFNSVTDTRESLPALALAILNEANIRAEKDARFYDSKRGRRMYGRAA